MHVTFPQGKRIWKEMVPGGFLLITFCDDAMTESKAAGTYSSCHFTGTVKQRNECLRAYAQLSELLHKAREWCPLGEQGPSPQLTPSQKYTKDWSTPSR